MPKALVRSSDIDLLNNFWSEPVERVVLPNGLVLILKPDHSAQLASVQVWVKTGSVHEGCWLGAGVSHFLEHMLFKGTKRRQGRELSAEVQAAGGYINAYTTFDRTVYYIDLPSENFPVAVDILADAVLESLLPEDEFIKERDVILREIAMTRDDPDQRVAEGLFDLAFKEHPYKYPVIGHKELFEGLTHADLLAYYKSRYVPNNMVVVVTGALEVAQVRQEVDAHFGKARRAVLPQLWVPQEPLQLSGRSLNLYEDVELTRAGLAWQVPGLTHPDAPALDLLAVILGAGDSCVFWQSLREKARLVHSIDAQNWCPGSSGLFFVSLNCDPDKHEAAVKAVQAEIATFIRTGPRAADMRKAIRQLVVGEINTRKTMAGQASRLGAAEVVAGDLQFSRAYFDRLRQVSGADLKRVAAQYLVPERLTQASSHPLPSTPKNTSSAARLGAAGDFEPITLANGARIVWQLDTKLPNVHMRLTSAGGPLFEPSDRRGISALFATLLTKDTKKRSAERVARAIEEVGGGFYAFSGNNSLGLVGEALSTDAARLLSTVQEASLEPAFLEETLERERESQLADLKQDNDDIVTRGKKRLRARFFGAHPLSMDSHGDEAGVAAVSRADLVGLHQRLFTAPNLVLAVSGDFKPDKFLPQLEGWLSKLPTGERVAAAPSFTPPAATEYFERMQREQAVVFQAYGGPSLKDEDHYVAEVADELFSGMASRLFERVREEKGLAYFVRSARVTGLSTGMFYFFAGTAPDKTQEVFAEIEAEIERVAAGGVEAAELGRCLARLKAGRRQSMQTASARCLNASLNELFGLPLNDWRNYDAKISTVSIAALAEFAQRRLKREQRLRLVVSP